VSSPNLLAKERACEMQKGKKTMNKRKGSVERGGQLVNPSIEGGWRKIGFHGLWQ